MNTDDLFVYYVDPDPTSQVSLEVSPPFATEEEARAYQADNGGSVWRFPLLGGTGEVLPESN